MALASATVVAANAGLADGLGELPLWGALALSFLVATVFLLANAREVVVIPKPRVPV